MSVFVEPLVKFFIPFLISVFFIYVGYRFKLHPKNSWSRTLVAVLFSYISSILALLWLMYIINGIFINYFGIYFLGSFLEALAFPISHTFMFIYYISLANKSKFGKNIGILIYILFCLLYTYYIVSNYDYLPMSDLFPYISSAILCLVSIYGLQKFFPILYDKKQEMLNLKRELEAEKRKNEELKSSSTTSQDEINDFLNHAYTQNNINYDNQDDIPF